MPRRWSNGRRGVSAWPNKWTHTHTHTHNQTATSQKKKRKKRKEKDKKRSPSPWRRFLMADAPRRMDVPPRRDLHWRRCRLNESTSTSTSCWSGCRSTAGHWWGSASLDFHWRHRFARSKRDASIADWLDSRWKCFHELFFFNVITPDLFTEFHCDWLKGLPEEFPLGLVSSVSLRFTGKIFFSFLFFF